MICNELKTKTQILGLTCTGKFHVNWEIFKKHRSSRKISFLKTFCLSFQTRTWTDVMDILKIFLYGRLCLFFLSCIQREKLEILCWTPFYIISYGTDLLLSQISFITQGEQKSQFEQLSVRNAVIYEKNIYFYWFQIYFCVDL